MERNEQEFLVMDDTIDIGKQPVTVSGKEDADFIAKWTSKKDEYKKKK